ncbi:MAG: response regulator [Candidatus Staskawiczbacteria bacterium]|nr:response regulator [Candidatus Staskawiczbacteria bacterium]
MIDQINKKILVVEDDEDFLSILKMKFASENISIITAKDGEEGIVIAEKEKPDLVITDVLIPKMNGVEMIKKIKEFNKNVLVIFLTNIKEEDYTKDVEELGADYLIKADLRINDIVEKVKIKLGLKTIPTI